MPSCSRCGAPADGASRFCGACGAPLDPPAPRQEVRKTVTVLFCDVVDSTVLGENTDPETVRQALARYFDEMRAIVERHGGIVERFRGDEVMAVFGVPTVHEDDALRAVRSAAAMRQRLVSLNEELLATWGVELRCRIGINTGEVVAGDPGTGATFVTGDAVNLAKRLEQAAGPGEILIGTATYPLVKDAVKVGPRERFTVKGKRDPVSPFRLDDVDAFAAGVARRLDAPLVGREEELALLQAELEACERELQCRLVTVIGPAGIGKSRLAAELLARAGDRVRALRGRCLPYGDAITFWPLVEIFREAGGEESLATLDGVEEGEAIAEIIRAIAGETLADAPAEETFWAVRRYLEELARDRPLVVYFEDVHWAAPTLLDLVEYLAGWTRGAPVLILVLARSELLESRPSWAAPRDNAALLPLEPLSEDDSELLLERLVSAELSTSARRRIAGAAEGNPLFVEQMAAMADDLPHDAERLPVPPTIQALLAERLDRLSVPERTLLERASVFGREFSYRTLVDLSPPEDREGAATHLFSLVRKDLFRPVRSEARDDLLAFRHDLIRAAAYEAVPKILRAELHERLAERIEQRAGDGRAHLGEVAGYHFEQAHRYLTELRTADERTQRLASRAAHQLGAAGRRAFARDDMSAAASLFARASALLDDGAPERLDTLRDLAQALWEAGRSADAMEAVERLRGEAAAAGAERVEALAVLERLAFEQIAGASTDVIREAAERAIALSTVAADELGLARAWRRLASAHRRAGEYGAGERAAREALEHARGAGSRQEEARAVDGLCNCLLYGPTPVAEALDTCSELLTTAGGTRALQANVLGVIAGLETMRSDIAAARLAYSQAAGILEELGLELARAALTHIGTPLELEAGDPEAAEREARRGAATFARAGSANLQAPLIAEALAAQGRIEDAGRELETAALSEGPSLAEWQVRWRLVRARLWLAGGRLDESVAAGREAAAIADATDELALRGDVWAMLAEALARTGADAEAAEAAETARALYTRKGNTAGLSRLAGAVPVA